MFFVFELTTTRQPQVAGGGEWSQSLGRLVKFSSHESFHGTAARVLRASVL